VTDPRPRAAALAAGPPAAPGTVHLVGVGPGDAGMLTLRAAQLLSTADLIAHDKLVPAEVLALARPGAQLVDVGRRAGGAYIGRAAVDELLRDAARSGRAVVRCKGGDPYVFGRGAEEAVALEAAGIPVEVVPGITSAIAVPAAAGIPVTLRGVSPGVAVVTGHEDPAKPGEQLDLEALASFGGTLVVLMGRRTLPRLVQRLLDAGRAPTTPAAVVAQGGWPGQVLVEGTLATIAERAEAADVPTPAVVVVGEVVAHRVRGADRGRRQLHGTSVVLPRLSDGTSRLAVALRHAGAQVDEPLVQQRQEADQGPLREIAEDCAAGRLDTLVLTSTDAHDALLAALVGTGHDVRGLASVRLWVSGRRTAARLRERGVVADLVVDGPASLRAAPPTGAGRVAVLAADAADGGIGDALSSTGAQVRRVATSRSVATGAAPTDPDAIALVAASRLAASMVGHRGPVVALGPTIATALWQVGVEVAAVTADTTPDAALAAVAALVDRADVGAATSAS
jgi:uroporphyrinogen III methyltransferase / synthase